jgi:hypothetical protein
VKISEHPTQKVHKLHLRREAAYDEAIGRAAESIDTRPILSMNPTSPNDPQLGTLMLEEGVISDSQLQEALRTQSELDVYRPLGQILVDQKKPFRPNSSIYSSISIINVLASEKFSLKAR